MLYHISLALQCVYGCNDERSENGDGKDRSEIPRRGEEEITWPRVFK